MPFELTNLFDFKFLINDMQKIIIEQRKRGVSEAILRPSVERIDKLIEICKSFDKYYYSAHYASQKIMQLEHDKLVMSEAIDNLKLENENLLKSIQWK